MHAELCQKRAAGSLQVDTKARSEPSFCTPSILELVELVLRPPKGGPPVLPEQSDAVLKQLYNKTFLPFRNFFALPAPFYFLKPYLH